MDLIWEGGRWRMAPGSCHDVGEHDMPLVQRCTLPLSAMSPGGHDPCIGGAGLDTHCRQTHTFVSQDSKRGRPSVRLTGGRLSLRTVSFCSGIFLQESLLRHPRPNLVTRRLSNIPEILQSGAGINFHRGSQHIQSTDVRDWDF